MLHPERFPRVGHQFTSVVINHQARSLFFMIADGKYRATSLGRNTWKKLIGSRASLQPNCNKEGLNAIGASTAHSKARIGIFGNNENECNSCDSRIGFGTGGYHDDSNTCGNEAIAGGDNSLRSRRLEVVGIRKNGRARRRQARGEVAPARKAPENRFPPPLQLPGSRCVTCQKF